MYYIIYHFKKYVKTDDLGMRMSWLVLRAYLILYRPKCYNLDKK